MPVTRRTLMTIGGPAVAGGAAWAGWRVPMSRREYDRVLSEMTQPLPDTAAPADLVRYATLAANGHNTQPWLFRPGPQTIAILPDLSRRTPVVDPDDHHLYASLGCAAENLALAARGRGLSGGIEGRGAEGLLVDLTPGPAEETPLLAAIPQRRSTRAAFDGQPVTLDVLKRLEAAAGIAGVTPVLLGPERLEPVVDLVTAGNSAQIADPTFLAELKRWLRFNPRDAARARDGLYSAASGNPTLPGWLGPIMFDLVFDAAAENDKYAAQIRSSAGVIVLLAPTDDPAGWAAAGRAAQRLGLQATAEGLKLAFVNQAVEDVPSRRQLQALLGADRRPSLVLRFGRGPEMPASLRRPAAAVMIA